jgi:hypothetical protein
MELPNLSDPLSIPDVFWSAGDFVFQKTLPQDWRHKLLEEQMMHRMAEIRGNLNYHLLTHRRLVIPDTSLLYNQPLINLFRQYPAYQDYLSQGIIVPAMRENVTSFENLVPILRKGKNWVEPSQSDLDNNAKFLDSLRPTVATTMTNLNRELMDEIGSEKLLQSGFWEAVGLGKASEKLIKFVPKEMQNNNQKQIRQTEFWNYAAKLDNQGRFLQAQKIRGHLSIVSLGVMSKTLNLPLSYPAAYSQQIDLLYGTRSPFQNKKNIVIAGKSLLEEKTEDVQQNFYSAVYYLEPEMIWGLRESETYKKLLIALEQADTSSANADYENLIVAWRGYHHDLPLRAGLAITKKEKEWNNIRLTLRWLTAGELASTALGVLCSFSSLLTSGSNVLSIANTAATFYLRKRAENQMNQLESDARGKFETEIKQLRRDKGGLVSELYGPVAKEYWKT